MSSTMKLRVAAGVVTAVGSLAQVSLASNEVEREVEIVVESAGAEGVNLSGAACPQDESEKAHKAHSTKVRTTSRTNVVIKQDNGEGEVYELKMGDKDFIVLRNGNRVHDKHVKRFPGKVMLLNDSGEELTTFELEGMGKAPESGKVRGLWVGKGGQHGRANANIKADFVVNTQTENAFTPLGGANPPVMLGIMVGEPGPALRYHLGLGEHGAILVEGVTDGLAADEAGLRMYDVIVSLDGSGEADGRVLRKILSQKGPGDELRMIVMRGCDKIRLTADLDAYNADKLNTRGWQSFGGAPDKEENVLKFRTAPRVIGGRPFVWSDDQGELLELLHDKLKGRLTGEQLEQTHKALQEALSGMDFDFEFGPDSGGMGVMEFKWDGKDRKLVFPKMKDQEAGYLLELMPQIERKIERHTEHAERKAEEIQERLSERLERLSEEIERLREALDDLD